MVGISKKSGTLKDIKYKEVFGGSTADAIKHIKYESMALGTLHFYAGPAVSRSFASLNVKCLPRGRSRGHS